MPKCRKELTQKQLFVNPKRDRENEITEWEPKCPYCGAKMVIFND